MNKSSIRKLAGLLVLTVLLAAAPLAPAEEAPNVTELMNSYTELDLSPYLGKTVFINFFTEWCYYCMQEMPDIKALYDTYSEDELAIVLVHVWDGENADNTASVKGKYGMEDMTFFEDEDMMVASLVGLQGYPASLFLNPDGTLEAAAHLLEQLGAKVVKIVCLLELKGLHGRDRLKDYPLATVVSYDGK